MDALAQHTTVLLTEAVDALLTPVDTADQAAQDGLYIDATFGRGGHTRLLLTRLSPRGRVLAFDRDPQAAAFPREVPRPESVAALRVAHPDENHRL